MPYHVALVISETDNSSSPYSLELNEVTSETMSFLSTQISDSGFGSYHDFSKLVQPDFVVALLGQSSGVQSEVGAMYTSVYPYISDNVEGRIIYVSNPVG